MSSSRIDSQANLEKKSVAELYSLIDKERLPKHVMTATGNKRLRVSGRNDLRSAMIGLNNKEEKIAVKIANKVGTLRHFGSNALELAAVGAGQLDAVILSKAPVWDIATASLFIKEAGGRMATMTGKTDLKDLIEADMILATNLSLFPKLERELK